MLRRIGKLFELDFGVPDGCADCHCVLFEASLVAWVDEKLTCKTCIDRYTKENRTRRKAAAHRRTGA